MVYYKQSDAGDSKQKNGIIKKLRNYISIITHTMQQSIERRKIIIPYGLKLSTSRKHAYIHK